MLQRMHIIRCKDINQKNVKTKYFWISLNDKLQGYHTYMHRIHVLRSSAERYHHFRLLDGDQLFFQVY